ncbi:helix-turn-helix transcriptional regulator [Micromonospora yangpuensis]|uniref:Transcriptional regulator, AraC family n=1 Tax=Micromonospora yangpuensis TaxID=683228 RepID=A0A1C6UUN8_9ACTN|nr:AraC family transcriptional regulator [Micromonospora yangpuensis]GGM24316.1 AraC family transcriptional regulator [Micromonospora yangpuensis]SCL57573.1 transcriptional regulator, AraC family [Micromonospora yangpuensis]
MSAAGTDQRRPGTPAGSPQQRAAVQRVVTALREHVEEPWTLNGMSRIAYLSPFHFNRVFRRVTGTPPGRFLSALRMARARHLLLSTGMTITDICTAVGYSSLGTFTTQFTEQVGMTPGRLRLVHAAYGQQQIGDLLAGSDRAPVPAVPVPGPAGRPRPAGGTVTGTVEAGPGPDRLILVGLFPGPVAQGAPVACTSRTGSGRFVLPDVPAGTFHLLATALPAQATVGQVMTDSSPADCWVGAGPRPVDVRPGERPEQERLALAPAASIDPPILSGLPLLHLTRAA